MTKKKYTLVDGTESYILTADEGKTIYRISDNTDFGTEVYLGYRYIDLNNRVLEVPTDFEERDYE